MRGKIMGENTVKVGALYPLAVGETPPSPVQRREVQARATDEFRPPLKGEWYLSGAIVEAYKAPSNLSRSFRIAELVRGRLVFEGAESASKSAGTPADMWASGDAGGSADKWDGVQVDLLDSFTTGEGDRVARIQVRGVPLIIFAYKDQSPQVIQYPNGQRSIHAFNMYKESLEN